MPNLSDAAFARRVLIAIALAALALLAWRLRDVLLLVFGAIVFAVLLRAIADPIARHTPLSGRWSVVVTALLLAALLVLGAWLSGKQLQDQVSNLSQQIPEALDRLKERINGWGWPGGIVDQLREVAWRPGVLSGVGTAAMAVLTGIADLLLVIFGGIYLAAQPALYRRGLVRLLPHRVRGQTDEALVEAGAKLRWWLIGRLVAMALVGLLTWLGLVIIGMPSALALGLLAGLLEFVPFVGPILAAIPALLIAVGQDTTTLLWVAALYLAIQQLEGDLITPLVQRRAVRLPPAITLFSVIAFALVFGPLGLLLATPLAVVVMVLVQRLWVRETLNHGEPAAEEARAPPPA